MNRAFRLVAALLLLAACDRGGSREAFIESRAPPGLATRYLEPEGWAWGALQVGDDPVQRYGVASPDVVPKGQVVIVPGYGETAEIWFETVRDLEASGLTVWVLDRAGQGGSQRFVEPRDLGHAPSFDPDRRALEALVRQIVRPTPDAPVTILSHGDGAVVALLALEDGLPADGAVLSAPLVRPSGERPLSMLERLLRSDQRPPAGWRPWRRSRPWASRADLAADWQLANPDLRMAGPSRGWRLALQAASRAALDRAGEVRTPVLEVGAASGSDPCERLPRCLHASVRPASSPHLADDAARSAWLKAVAGFALSRSPMVDDEPLR
ncbi:alpha/beta fold hydrolase [Phenylobacterium sp.]|uniref:alpha/beta fold hydrolase n=1 Tax=Phenylobacterium sp. TaxID=1871053 RepID=UPI0035AFAA75